MRWSAQKLLFSTESLLLTQTQMTFQVEDKVDHSVRLKLVLLQVEVEQGGHFLRHLTKVHVKHQTRMLFSFEFFLLSSSLLFICLEVLINSRRNWKNPSGARCVGGRRAICG